MITYVVDDLFTSPAQVLVNTVNTVGVMGKGIAKVFKRVYPDMFNEYQDYCENGMLDIGKLWLYKTSHKWILNFPTKKHWRSKSRLEYIEAGLQKFADTYDYKGIDSISFPLLGCGNGELDWESQVQPLMVKYLDPLLIDIYVHLFRPGADFVPEHKEIAATVRWLRSEPRSLPFSEFWDDLQLALQPAGSLYTALDGSQFCIILDNDGNGFTILQDDNQLRLEAEDLRDFWHLVRRSAYIDRSQLPARVGAYAKYTIPLLDRLEYISKESLSRYPSVHSTDVGLKMRFTEPVFRAPRYPFATLESA